MLEVAFPGVTSKVWEHCRGGQHEGAEERQSDAGVLYPLAPTICPEAGLVQARTFAMNRRGP